MSGVKNVEYGLEKIFEGAQDFLPLLGTDYVEFYVGNAKQAAYFYKSAFGFQSFVYKGLETGDKERASSVLQQDKIKTVIKGNVDVIIRGSQAGQPAELRLLDLMPQGTKPLSFGFKYFQTKVMTKKDIDDAILDAERSCSVDSLKKLKEIKEEIL